MKNVLLVIYLFHQIWNIWYFT